MVISTLFLSAKLIACWIWHSTLHEKSPLPRFPRASPSASLDKKTILLIPFLHAYELRVDFLMP